MYETVFGCHPLTAVAGVAAARERRRLACMRGWVDVLSIDADRGRADKPVGGGAREINHLDQFHDRPDTQTRSGSANDIDCRLRMRTTVDYKDLDQHLTLFVSTVERSTPTGSRMV
jgi:hypothetical protein